MFHIVNKNILRPENYYIVSAHEGFWLNKFSSLKLLNCMIKQKEPCKLKKKKPTTIMKCMGYSLSFKSKIRVSPFILSR